MEDVTFIQNILYLVITAGVAIAAEYIRRRLGLEKLKQIQEELATKKELALIAVKFVMQAYKDLNGPEKFKKAADWLANQAKAAGLKITSEEIKALIEWALREIKDQLGKEWGNIQKEPPA